MVLVRGYRCNPQNICEQNLWVEGDERGYSWLNKPSQNNADYSSIFELKIQASGHSDKFLLGSAKAHILILSLILNRVSATVAKPTCS